MGEVWSNTCAACSLGSRQSLTTKISSSHWNRIDDPFGVAGALGSEIPAVDDGRNAQAEGAKVLFQVGLDAADDHVGKLGNGVQNFLVDGGGLAHAAFAAQIRQANVGEQLKLPVPAQAPARPMKETTPSLASGMPVLDRGLASADFDAQHGGKHLRGRLGSRIPR